MTGSTSDPMAPCDAIHPTDPRDERLDEAALDDGLRVEPRQAVVVIHGIGDLPPMRTLRDFTHGIGLRRLFSSPDRMTGTDDLLRLTEPPTEHLRARTDFFEFYWGHHSPRGGLMSTVVWATRLLLRSEWRARHGHVAAVVLGIQAAFVLAVVAAAVALGWWLWSVWHGRPVLAGAWPVLGVALAIVLGAHLAVSGFVRRVLADAVRYLQPRPENNEARRAIRGEGLHLLRRLHASGDYDRIIVVGHSLGAVVGYDLIRSLWDEARHPDPHRAGDQRSTLAFDAAADRIEAAAAAGGDEGSGGKGSGVDASEVKAFQEAQFALWQADRGDGVPWLITDFVTIGSPLTYASLLFADPPLVLQGWPGMSLAEKQALKEYPRCPPILDEVEPGRFYTRDYAVDGGRRALRVGHTAAPFGPTRWTNLYLPSRFAVVGDLLAGAVAPEFGPGVRDISVRIAGRGFTAAIRRFFPASHLSYWWSPEAPVATAADVPAASSQGASDPADGRPPAAEAVAAALRLDGIMRVRLRPHPRPRAADRTDSAHGGATRAR